MEYIQMNELKEYIRKQPKDFYITVDLTSLTDKMDRIDKKEGVKDEHGYS